MLAACQTATTSNNATVKVTPKQTAPQTPADGIKRVTIDEARAAVAKGTAVIIDARSASDYKSSHIAGSINIPLEETEKRMGEIPRDKMAIFYCS